jgi:hypothetical protein
MQIIISDTNPTDINSQANLLFHNINTWFKNNRLLLNLNKTQYLEFHTKQSDKNKGQIKYNSSYLINASHIKFLGLIIDSTLTWDKQIDLVSKRLSSTCYTLNCIKYSLPRKTLKIIYFAHVQSSLSYGIIFWGYIPTASKVFTLKKKNLPIIYNIKTRDSCRQLFRQNQIMAVFSLYLYSLILFVTSNKHLFEHNNDIHNYVQYQNKSQPTSSHNTLIIIWQGSIHHWYQSI